MELKIHPVPTIPTKRVSSQSAGNQWMNSTAGFQANSAKINLKSSMFYNTIELSYSVMKIQ
jgi:hypothetical protein